MKIGVVGGGPTAVALLESLNRARDRTNSQAHLEVTVFDPSEHRWCGYSFAADRPEALTNVYTSDMSVRDWEPGHANAWFEAKGNLAMAGHNFAPRSLIGEYFRDSAQQAVSRMDAFRFVAEQVTRVTPKGPTVLVQTPTAEFDFDCVVLCVGRAMTSDPYGLAGEDRFGLAPYPLKESLLDVDPDEDIGIIGSGLTAIDLIAALKADGHRGRITMMSRQGLLPAVRRPPLKYEIGNFTVEKLEKLAAARGHLSLSDLVQLVQLELDCAGASKQVLVDELFPERYGIDRLRHHMSNVDDGEMAMSILIKMLLPFQDAWYLLDAAGKTMARRFAHIFSSLCCPMPRHRAAALLELADSGQLDVARGLQSVAKDENGRFAANVAGAGPLYFDRMYSAASRMNALDPMAIPLVEQLLRSGQALTHPFGGVDVERASSRVLDAGGQPQPRLYAIGTTTSGAFQVLNGFSVLRRRAVHIADSIWAHQRTTCSPLTEASGYRIETADSAEATDPLRAGLAVPLASVFLDEANASAAAGRTALNC